MTAQTPAGLVARLSAATANLNGGPDSVRIDVLSWSTDTVRNQLVDAWKMIAPAPGTVAPSAGAAGGRGACGRGARGGAPAAATRGNAPEAGAPETPSAPTTAAAPPAGRGGRGGARGGPAALPGGNAGAVLRDTPEKALAAALESANGVGYLWTAESTGYSLRYAYRMIQPDGTERIILATDRRLGERDDSWKPATNLTPDYAFSIIELRLNGKLEGEGKSSVSGKVTVDSSVNSIALDDYASLPVTLKNVKPRSAN